MGKEVVYRGRIYSSRKEIADQLGINYTRFNMGMTQQMTVSQAVKFAKGEYRKPRVNKGIKLSEREVEYNGEKYPSYSSLADAIGLGNRYRNIMRCLKEGKTLDEAVEYVRSIKRECRKNPDVEDHLGNKYASYAKMATAYGIPSRILTRRLQVGWEKEEALTAPVFAVNSPIRNKR